MGNNTDKNSSNMNDGILWGIGFISMAFILFFAAFFMGREIGKKDETVFKEYTKTLESDRDEIARKLESIESKIEILERTIGELEEKIDEMPKTSANMESQTDTGTNENGIADSQNE